MSAGNIEVKLAVVTCTVTEREAVERERAAFCEGAESLYVRDEIPGAVYSAYAEVRDSAPAKYPLPKITRERIKRDPSNAGWRWCVRGGAIALYDSDSLPMCTPTPERTALWADLLANPTEQVDA